MLRFFKHGGEVAWGLIASVILVIACSTVLFAGTADLRYQRDVSRLVFNDNVGVLERIKQSLGMVSDSVTKLESASPDAPRKDQPYIVVSIEDHRLWYKRGDSVLFTAPVATGSGKELLQDGGNHWHFETPRGRLLVQAKDTNPEWLPPDWHFVEQAHKRGLGLTHLERGQTIPLSDGSQVTVDGTDVVRRAPDGREVPFAPSEGHEIVANGNIVVPPYGTNQRKYKGVLGTRRLELGDGYGIHGTDEPESIGHSVSHGCVRLRNPDVETLYDMVSVGTPVYIY